MTCPGKSEYRAPGVTPESFAAAKDQSPRVLHAIAAIDFCGPTDPVACPSDTAPAPACSPSPCPRRTLTRGVRPVVSSDVAVIEAALDRAGFPEAEVKLTEQPRMIRYVVPVGPLCLVGIMLNTDPTQGNDLGWIGPSGHC